MSGRARRRAVATAAWSLDQLVRWSQIRVGLALVHHGVADEGGPAMRALLPPESADTFRAQMTAVASRYRVVPAGELPEAIRTRRRGERIPLAVTFDDDLRSHVDDVAPVLQALGIPATFYLTGAALERPVRFWWESFDAALAQGRPVAEVVARYGIEPLAVDGGSLYGVGISIETMAEDRRRALAAELEALAGPVPDDTGLRPDDVRRLAEQGFEIGFHTREHPSLVNLDDDALDRALRTGCEDVAAAAGRPLTSIAYPHGAWDARVARAARAAGWSTGYTVDAVAVKADDDDLALPRIDPFGLPAQTLLVRLATASFRAGAQPAITT